jgi:hypothetical protein
MKIARGISRRSGVILVTLALVAVVVAVLLAGRDGNGEAETQLFLITFHESIDRALVEEYGGEIWIMYPPASRINAWMTPEAAEALAEHEAVEYVDQRQLFAIMFENESDVTLVEEYGGEVFYQSSVLPVVDAFMMPEAAEALAEHPSVRCVEPDWPLESLPEIRVIGAS